MTRGEAIDFVLFGGLSDRDLIHKIYDYFEKGIVAEFESEEDFILDGFDIGNNLISPKGNKYKIIIKEIEND